MKKAKSLIGQYLRMPAALVVVGGSLLGTSATVHATDGTWKNTSNSGNWSDTLKWTGGVPDGVDSTAALLSPTVGTTGGYTINLDGDRTIGSLTLAAGTWTTTQNYTISGTGTLTFATTAGTPTITVPAGTASTVHALTLAPATIAGTQGLKITGAGLLYLNPATVSLTGGITIDTANVLVTSSSAYGSNAITLGNGSTGLSRMWFDVTGSDVSIANSIALNSTTSTSGFLFAASSTNVVTLSGAISQNGAAKNALYSSNVNVANGQRYIVSGNNSYTGNTTIGASTNRLLVLAQNNNAFGTGTANVTVFNNTSGVGLAGNITISNKTLTLNGTGFGDGTAIGFNGVAWQGSLFNQSGTNTWAGNVAVGAATTPTIGVASSSKLIISGTVTGAASGGLVKKGVGTLELTAANTFSGGSDVSVGTLLLSNAAALGTGSATVDAGGILRVSAGTIAQTTSLSLTTSGTGGSTLSFDLNSVFAGTELAVTGNQLGSGIFDVDIFNTGSIQIGTYTLMTVAGTTQATSFNLAQITGGQGTLGWNGNDLTLNVTSTVPEPSSVALISCAAALLGFAFKRSARSKTA